MVSACGLVIVAAQLAATASVSHLSTIDLLNQTVNGRVHSNRPYALPCFSMYEGTPVARDEAACARVQANYTAPKVRNNIPGAYMGAQSEMCISDPEDQCELDPKNPYNAAAYTNKNCRQGDVPPYYMEITNEHDVQAAFSYSRASGTRLVVKNSGHDFLGHSSKKGALALWTRNLRNLKYSPSFRPSGCDSSIAPKKAITMGAGVNCGEAYRFARDNRVTILCGYAETVGLSGGWVQNGGHSVLSAAHGLGVDRVLEFKIVTPDGVYRTANAYENQDVFWALRGGGGNTFGVVLESTHLVEEDFPVVSIHIGFDSEDDDATLGFMKVLIENAVAWGDKGIGGHIVGTSVVYLTSEASLEEVKNITKPLSDYVLARSGYSDVKQLESFHGFYREFITTNTAAAGPATLAASRLIDRDVMASKEGQEKLVAFYKDIIAHKGTLYVPVDTPVIYKGHVANSTSVTPGWYKSIWHITTGVSYAYNSTLAERKQAVDRALQLTKTLKDISPNTGAYMNEANPFTPDWQEDFWGMENYARLLDIKERYDPDRLLLCWRCVGWRESDVASACERAFNN